MTRQVLTYLSEAPVPFCTAWQWQKAIVARKQQHPDTPDVLLLLEHPPTYTLGQGASLEFLKFDPRDPGLECHRIERGGEVTYHAPGQLVGYPLLDLSHYRRDLHWYLRQLEEVLLRTLQRFDLFGDRIAGLTGVWIGDRKVGQLGIKVSRWITMHGFALNVDLDLAGFDRIVPCGLRDRACCSMAQFLPDIRLGDVRQAIVESFAEVFEVTLTPETALERWGLAPDAIAQNKLGAIEGIGC